MEIKIDKVLETVFIKEHNTTALILENDIVVSLWNGIAYNRKECFDYINEYKGGIVQTTNDYREAMAKGEKTGAVDCLKPYEDLYDNLNEYAKVKFANDFKPKN